MKKGNKWASLVFGVIVLLFAGLIYGWSQFKSNGIVYDPDFSSDSIATQLQFTFTLAMICFCLGGLVSGIIIKKVKARIMLLAAALLYVVGFYFASQTHSLLGLWIFFGVIAALGSGFAYNAVLSSVADWFPDKKGTISGTLLMGFGLGSFIIGKLYQMWTPAETDPTAWRTSFMVLGGAAALVCIVGSFFIKAPPADFVAPAKAKKTEEQTPAKTVEIPTGTMMKTPQLWLYYVWAILLSGAGLALIGQAQEMAVEVGGDAISAGTVVLVVGLISVFNGLGRVLLGGLYDKFGRSKTMLLVCVLFIIDGGVLILAFLTKSFVITVIAFILGGLAYSGVTPTNTAFTGSYYGLKYYSVNMAVVTTNLIFASFASTISSSLKNATGSFLSVYIMMIGLAVAGIFISIAISIADKKKPVASFAKNGEG